MEDISLKPSIAFSGLIVFLVLAVFDVSLLVHSLHQGKEIAGIARQQAATLPTKGQLLPVLKGTNLKNGKWFAIDPSGNRRFALLIFREGCGYCALNWENWETLFGHHVGLDLPVVMATTDKTLSQSYRDKHELLSMRTVILGVDPEMLGSLKLGATPETLYVVDGKIKEDWVGVLANEDMKEIKKAMSED